VRGRRIARELGLSIDPSFETGSGVRRAIEVYPHPAIVALFALPLTLKHKAKSGRATAGRCAAFAQLLAHLEGLADASPPLDVTASPRWRDLRLAVAEPATGAALDRAEDEIDAYVCAGAIVDLPTVGVTHRPVLAEGDWPRDERGAQSPLRLEEEIVGHWLRTRAGTRPLAVHAAWRTDPETAVAVALASLGRWRTPEPLRAARRRARTARGRMALARLVSTTENVLDEL
jgi:hypothetical protein